MEMTMSMGAFQELDDSQALMVDGGASTIGKALVATGGAVLIAWAPITALAIVATGGVGLVAVGTAVTMVGMGVSGIAASTH